MNERILELADKAIEDMPGAWNIPDEFCEKFAELIVKECASRCVLAPIDYICGEAYANRIKQHFGVEE
jgi:hypothetical protein